MQPNRRIRASLALLVLAAILLLPLLAHAEGSPAVSTKSVAAVLQPFVDKHALAGAGVFGHGGAHSTNMTIDANRGLITVFMVQHAGFPKDGNKSQAAFHKAAIERFSAPRK